MTYKRVTDQVLAPASHPPLFCRSPERVSELLVVTQLSRKARGRVRASWAAMWASPAVPLFSAKAWELPHPGQMRSSPEWPRDSHLQSPCSLTKEEELELLGT